MTRFYSVRRLSPFEGTIQVIHLEEARAVSLDGVHWRFQLLSKTAVRERKWGDLEPGRYRRPYFNYGEWSLRDGLRRLPINPALGDANDHLATAVLLDALRDRPSLPFANADNFELWLLDAQQGRPLALVDSCMRPPTQPPRRSVAWTTLPHREREPFSADAIRSGDDNAPRSPGQTPAEALERFVARRAGGPIHAQWFFRRPDGAGERWSPLQGQDPGGEHPLAADYFPELLLRGDWPEREAARLVPAYFCWQSPRLLTLPRLCPATRQCLEQAACRRPDQLHRHHRLLPDVYDRRALNAALVEAVLRACT